MISLGTAALIAMIAGTAMQQYANYSANKAAQKQLNEAMYQLNDDGKKINDVIGEASQEFDNSKRQAQQQEIAKEVSDEIKGNVAESQALRNESQSVQGNVSNDYLTAREAAQQKTEATSNAFADLVGKIRSAAQLRQNEGIGLMKAGQQVDQLARNARGNWQVGQVRVNDAMHSKDALKSAGQIVSALGAAMSLGSLAGAGSAAQAGTSTLPEALTEGGQEIATASNTFNLSTPEGVNAFTKAKLFPQLNQAGLFF